jgi:hypothetical protein
LCLSASVFAGMRTDAEIEALGQALCLLAADTVFHDV